MLGVRVKRFRGELRWCRDNAFNKVPVTLARWAVFSVCGELVGYLPVCSWLRVAAACIKRRANAVTCRWDDDVKDNGAVRGMLEEVVRRVKMADPASGRWNAGAGEMTFSTEVSSLALGVFLEDGGEIVEDACWLRTHNATHINLSELDAAIKGLNMALMLEKKTHPVSRTESKDSFSLGYWRTQWLYQAENQGLEQNDNSAADVPTNVVGDRIAAQSAGRIRDLVMQQSRQPNTRVS